jgi:uncharacterized protein YodC (DUF2158 family)
MKTYAINDFTVGEVVYLKSDFTIQMVINKIDTNEDLIHCYWRDKKKNQSMNEFFPPSVLCKENDLPPRSTIRVQAL